MNIALLGKHGNRTPFSYSVYRRIFTEKGMDFVSQLEKADFIVLGFKVDLYEHFNEITSALNVNPDIKVVVFSEEPLWDSLWSSGFQSVNGSITKSGEIITYYNINHFTSDVFDYLNLPYFITTENSYISRYCQLFRRNSNMSKSELIKNWAAAKHDFASIAEKRDEDKFHKDFLDIDCIALNRFRTQLAGKHFGSSTALVEGKGWVVDAARQELVDWHLDKLAKLDKNCKFVSAIENTKCRNYTTEKIFDAFAVLGVPLYMEGIGGGLGELINPKSYIAFKSRSVNEAFELLSSFEVSSEFTEAYRETQCNLSITFSDIELINNERRSVVTRVMDCFDRLKLTA